MKTACYTAYGSPETITFVDTRVPRPAAGEVLVRVHAAPVTAGDARMRSGRVPRGFGLLLRLVIGWNRPRIAPGWAFSGEVAGLGAGVASFAIGQRVFGLKGIKGGAHAEYLGIRADGTILPLPDNLSHEEGAAFFFGGLTALQFLTVKAGVQPGERVLINGATGAVGSAAIQIAAHLGARVTAVASSPNHAMALRLGATAVHDYREGPVSGSFDVILDVMGTYGWAGAHSLLAPGGRLCLITADLAATLGATLRPRRQGRRIIAGTSSEAKAAMEHLVRVHGESGYTPVVGQVLPFDQLQQAHRIAESFHKPGNLVVVMTP
jgi:NADPH:quinone reductase-like Zn-dependent oxidoreductase